MFGNLEIIEQIGIIMTGFAGSLGAILLILQRLGFKNKKSKYVSNLESQINKLKKELLNELDNETDKAHDTHVRIFDKLEELSNNISFIKGLLKEKD